MGQNLRLYRRRLSLARALLFCRIFAGLGADSARLESTRPSSTFFCAAELQFVQQSCRVQTFPASEIPRGRSEAAQRPEPAKAECCQAFFISYTCTDGKFVFSGADF